MENKNNLDFEIDNFLKSEPVDADNFVDKVMYALPAQKKSFYLSFENFVLMATFMAALWKLSLWIPKASLHFWSKLQIIVSFVWKHGSLSVSPSIWIGVLILSAFFVYEKTQEI